MEKTPCLKCKWYRTVNPNFVDKRTCEELRKCYAGVAEQLCFAFTPVRRA